MEDMSLIGMERVKNEILELIQFESVYKKGNAKIPNYIIMLDAGNGQTYTTEAITDILVTHGLREFHGLDEYLEYKPDGSLPNIKWMFSDIADNAIYDNGYKGVISIDVSRMANVQNEYQMKYFEENLAGVAETATILLYCATNLGKKGETLIKRLRNAVENVKVIEYVEYTSGEFAEMIVRNILERGIIVSDEDKVVKVLSEIVTNKEIRCAKEAVMLAEKLVFYADYSKSRPVLSFGKANDFKSNYCKGA